jgi:hypothetical protein
MEDIAPIEVILEDRTEKQIGAPVESDSEVVTPVYADADKDESRNLLSRILNESRRKGGSVKHDRQEQKADFITHGIWPRPHFLDGGFSQRETEIIHIAFQSPVPAASLFSDLRSDVLKWLENKKSRSLKLIRGATEIEVGGDRDLDAALETLKNVEIERIGSAQPEKIF